MITLILLLILLYTASILSLAFFISHALFNLLERKATGFLWDYSTVFSTVAFTLIIALAIGIPINIALN